MLRRRPASGTNLISIPPQTRDVYFSLLITANKKKRLVKELQNLEEKLVDIKARLSETEEYMLQLISDINATHFKSPVGQSLFGLPSKRDFY